MNTRSNTNKVATETQLRAGDVLLAKPFWQEEDYRRSVILLLDHDKAGSIGIILNKISNLIVHDALPQLNLYHPIYYGGGINNKSVCYVHNFPDLPEVRSLGNGIYFGGEPDSLEQIIHTNILNSGGVKFCAGCVQWDAGQLEEEIRHDKWWTASITAEELFTMPHERLWAYKLLSTGHMYGIFNDDEDPYLN